MNIFQELFPFSVSYLIIRESVFVLLSRMAIYIYIYAYIKSQMKKVVVILS